MKISYKWLKNYIDTDLSPEEIAKILTNTGLEVEGIERYESIEGGLEGLVVGKVNACSKHPNADKLSVTKVDVGEDKELPIVCGAPNVAEGQKVAVAKVGTTLNMNNKPFEIKKTKIRGETSEGMICAKDEIGLGDSHEGILVLDDSAPVGQPLKDYFQVETDTVLEIDLTPNRIDGASHIGSARDLVAYLKQTSDIELKKPDVSNFKKDNDAFKIDVEIDNPEACPRYSGVTITDIEVKPSPNWLQNRIKAIGLTPINNLVDISNFVLHETGHPLHFFDADKIQDNKIVVKTLPEGTSFKTLDEEERKLSSEDLMICDTKNPLCIAGVLGGISSGVTEQTKNVFIESAYFNPKYIRKTAKRHGLSTDASYRFERGADPNNTLFALKRAALLVKDLANGKVSSDIVDKYPNTIHNAKVNLKLADLSRIGGISIELPTLKNILDSLDIKILNETSEELELQIPTYRVDVTREVDVIEEILRIYGYNNVETTQKLKSSLTYTEEIDKEKYGDSISEFLAGKGFNEIMCNSITKADYYNDLQTYPKDNLVMLHNPLSNDLNAMRQTLLFGGLETIAFNRNRQRTDLKLFEIGNCYHLLNKKDTQEVLDNYAEESHLGMFITGNLNRESWTAKPRPTNFFHLKGYVENILNKLGIETNKIKVEEVENEIFAQGLAYKLKKQTLVTLGIVHEDLLEKFDIETDVFYADMNYGKLLQLAEKNITTYKEIPKFPEVRRDLALLLNDDIKFEQIRELAYQSERKFLKDVSIFDVYRGEKLGANKKSYGVSFILQDEQKTLTDKQIDKIMDKFIKTFKDKLGAEIR
jgi:phenylalanyl-tRNA synthetase beta chain